MVVELRFVGRFQRRSAIVTGDDKQLAACQKHGLKR